MEAVQDVDAIEDGEKNDTKTAGKKKKTGDKEKGKK